MFPSQTVKLITLLTSGAQSVFLNHMYTQQKKKRTTTIFPLRSPYNAKIVNCHEILISDQILLKLECDVNEYLYLSFVSTKHIKASGKRVFEALFQRYCLHGIRAYFTFAKYENDTLSLCETTNVFIDAFLLFQNPFSSVRPVYID